MAERGRLRARASNKAQKKKRKEGEDGERGRGFGRGVVKERRHLSLGRFIVPPRRIFHFLTSTSILFLFFCPLGGVAAVKSAKARAHYQSPSRRGRDNKVREVLERPRQLSV